MSDLLREISGYYSDKLAEFGATPSGVDWNGSESQDLRFRQLSKVIDRDSDFSVNDLGCGYGAMLEYLSARYGQLKYRGYDISQAMLDAAREAFSGRSPTDFVLASAPTETADFGVASGIFNVKLDADRPSWEAYITSTLDAIDATSKYGFAFNCLTSYSDQDRMRDSLYYGDPSFWFDLCKRKYSRQVALLHDYGLFEFTMIVRKA